MAASRLRQKPATVFDVFVEVAPPDGDEKAFVLWKYPEDFQDEQLLRSVTEFAFPCEFQSSDAVQLFTFVLTDLDSRYTFGFCRHAPRSHTCLCILSALPWPELFFKLLNALASTADNCPIESVNALLDSAYHQEIPAPGQTFVIQAIPCKTEVESVCPDPRRLSKIPENRALTEYYNAVTESIMVGVFASLLCERRVVFTSAKLGKLSACVLAANMLLYPMQCAPMPFIIGVPDAVLREASKETDLSEVAILDIDRKQFSSPFDEVSCLPPEMLSILKKNLRAGPLIGDGLARSFLRAIVCLIGGYREALQFRPGESITFNQEAFLQTRPAHFRSFLEKMFHLQIFQQFIEDRLQKLNSGEGFMDEFEDECASYSDKNFNKYKYQYNEWMKNMKKEGGALVKQIRTKVKTKGKETIKDLRGKFDEFKEESPFKTIYTSRRSFTYEPTAVKKIQEKIFDRRSPRKKLTRCQSDEMLYDADPSQKLFRHKAGGGSTHSIFHNKVVHRPTCSQFLTPYTAAYTNVVDTQTAHQTHPSASAYFLSLPTGRQPANKEDVVSPGNSRKSGDDSSDCQLIDLEVPNTSDWKQILDPLYAVTSVDRRDVTCKSANHVPSNTTLLEPVFSEVSLADEADLTLLDDSAVRKNKWERFD